MRSPRRVRFRSARGILVVLASAAIGCGAGTSTRSPPSHRASAVTAATDTAPLAAAPAPVASASAKAPFAGIDQQTLRALEVRLLKAAGVAAEAFELLGLARGASLLEIRREDSLAAREKILAAQAILDAGEPTKTYPREMFPTLYAHADFLRATNLYLLALIDVVLKQQDDADRKLTAALPLAEGALEVSERYASDPAFAQNATSCAGLAIKLHHQLAVTTALAGDKAATDEHRRRERELSRWLQTQTGR